MTKTMKYFAKNVENVAQSFGAEFGENNKLLFQCFFHIYLTLSFWYFIPIFWGIKKLPPKR